MEPDRLGHDASPSRLERAKNVRLGFRRRRRRQQKRILEPETGEGDGQVGAHGSSISTDDGTMNSTLLTIAREDVPLGPGAGPGVSAWRRPLRGGMLPKDFS